MATVGFTAGVRDFSAVSGVPQLKASSFLSLQIDTALPGWPRLAMKGVGALHWRLPRNGRSNKPVFLKFSITLRNELPRRVVGVPGTSGKSYFCNLGDSHLEAG